MSEDERIATKLIHTLENGRLGFETAAERLNDERPDVAVKFRQFSEQRESMSDQLKTVAAAYGDDVDQRSTLPGAIHRGWIAVKDALTGADGDAVINAAETGEDHAVEEYEEALAADGLSSEFRGMIADQLASVRATHDYVRDLVRG